MGSKLTTIRVTEEQLDKVQRWSSDKPRGWKTELLAELLEIEPPEPPLDRSTPEGNFRLQLPLTDGNLRQLDEIGRALIKTDKEPALDLTVSVLLRALIDQLDA